MKFWGYGSLLLVLSITLVSCGQRANSSTERSTAQAKSERLANAKTKQKALKKSQARKRHAKAVSVSQAKQATQASKQAAAASSSQAQAQAQQASAQQAAADASTTRQVASSQNQQPRQPQKQTQPASQPTTSQPQANRNDPNTWNRPYRGYPSYNAYCEANNGDPDVQRETNEIQTQWAIKNGIMNPDGTLTPKGQAQANATE